MMQAEREVTEHETVAARAVATPALPRDDAGTLPVGWRDNRRLSDAVGARPALSITTRLGHAFQSAASVETDQGLAFLFLPVAMGAGAGLYYMSPTDPPLLLLAAGLMAALLAGVLTRLRHNGVARMAGFAAALISGSLAAAFEAHNGVILLDSDVTTSVTGLVEAREFDPDGRVRYLIRLMNTVDPQIRRPPDRVRLSARRPHQPAPVGSQISGRARLTAPSGPVMPGGYDFAFRSFADGIGAQGYFYRAPAYNIEPQDGRGLVQVWRDGMRTAREDIAARIRLVLPGDPGGIAAALTVSDRRGISRETVDALRATGLAHILAISGLHMALAAGILYIGVRKFLAVFPALVEALPVKKIAAIGALLTATAYLLISGGSVSTQRAWVMLTVMLVAVLADRPALTMRNVALAAIVIILISPSAVVGPGFQMSFAATAALISAYAAIARRARNTAAREVGQPARTGLRSLPVLVAKAMLGLAITSLVAGLATGLFSAHHFHRVAGNGLLANLLAMPLVTFIVMPAGLLAMLVMPFGLEAWPLRLMGQGLEAVIAAANFVNDLGGDVSVGQIPVEATLIAGTGFVLLVFLRSWLRLFGLVLICLGLTLVLPPLKQAEPDLLISEDGTLVGLRTRDGLASNAARPSSFIFRQWQTALRGVPHLPPLRAEAVKESTVDEPDPVILDQLLAQATGEPSRFHCASRGICAAIHKQLATIAIDEASLIGAACDRADLVIVAVPVYLGTCRSGATLVTSRTLRRSGALAIVVGKSTRTSLPQNGPVPDPETRPDIRIRAALNGITRPWTIQRYYDWRTDTFDLPN
jgi:ComEC/Rec2-related protein